MEVSMTRAEALVLEAARQLVAKYDPELVEAPWDFRTTLMALGLALKALDRAGATITVTDKGREEMPRLIDALRAGKSLDLGVRRLRDCGAEGRCGPEERHS